MKPLRAEAATRAPARPKTSAAAVAAVDFDTIYRQEQARVLGIVRGIIGPSDELEDVGQLAFIEIHRCLPRFEGRSRLSTWVYRIAVNVALQHLRRRKRRRWLMLGATGDEPGATPCRVDAVRRLEDRQVLEHVYGAVNALSEKKRTVWILHELEGLDHPEIAEILDLPLNTVRSRLIAARRDLMAALERHEVAGRGRS